MNNKQQPWLCIIGASHSHVPFIKAANQLNLKTIVFDRNKNAPGYKLADHFEAISTHDVEGIIAACKRQNNSKKIIGCLTYSSDSQALKAVAKVSELLCLKGFSTEALNNINNKCIMKERLREFNIPTPEFFTVHNLEEVYQLKNKLKNIIIKPATGACGSIGVCMTPTTNQNLEILFKKAFKYSEDDNVLVEVHYPGQEYSIDGYVQDGNIAILSIAHKFVSNLGPNFLINGFATGISPEKRRNKDYTNFLHLSKLTSRILTALKIDNSFFSIDIILGKNGPMVIDCGLLMDSKIDYLLKFSGTDIYDLRCRLAIGEKINYFSDWKSFECGYALRFLYANKKGRLHIKYDIIKKILKQQPDLIFFSWERQEGDPVKLPTSLADTIGWIIVKDSDRYTAWEKISREQFNNVFSVGGAS